MTLTKAMEILTLMGTPNFEGHTEDIMAARKLGIEALKLYQSCGHPTRCGMLTRLPGETPE